ncbi:MAG: SGNH/GDSL hydrolase family protein [Actinomycetota bacterium]|nr:SGNH/GDSL hydrolase family protein [Actinomycetota bacterium]
MRRVVLCVLATVALAAGAAAPAVAQAPVDYVALGDSYASGTGTRTYDPTSGSCLRSPVAYPSLWAASHAASTFVFDACSGATTAELLATQLSNLSVETDLVTVSIGGNDAGFARVLTECQVGGPVRCDVAIRQAEAFIAGELAARLDDVYAAVTERAVNARVLVMGYPRLFETGLCLTSISRAFRVRLNAVADQFAAVTAGRATAADAEFVDTREAFTGHRVCAPDEWINGPTFPVVESYHPDVDGHAKAYLPTLVAATG